MKMCNYPISSIHYPISSDDRGELDIGYWLLSIGYLHIMEMLPVANGRRQR